MRKERKVTAPLLDNYRWFFSCRDGITVLTKRSKEELSRLVEKLKRIEPTGGDETQSRWDFWIDVPKGELEDYGNYAELKAEGMLLNQMILSPWQNR